MCLQNPVARQVLRHPAGYSLRGASRLLPSLAGGISLTRVSSQESSLVRATNSSQLSTIINVFVFTKELDLLEIRLHELYQDVDHFVILESTFNHRAEPKPLFFNESRHAFAAFEPKIIHVPVTSPPPATLRHSELEDEWQDSLWRLGVRRSLPSLSRDALILLTSADEIPSRHIVNFLRYYRGFSPQLALLYRSTFFGFFWLDTSPPATNAVIRVAQLQLEFESSLSKFRRHGASNTTIGYPPRWAGWRCSGCAPVTDFRHILPAGLAHDLAEESDVVALATRRKTGHWFDIHVHAQLTSPPDDPVFAPPCVLTRSSKFSFLLYP
eukprot:m.158507 g.158507  ORF g.158507 m.158507 type:complete len:326 (-) comp52995_c0_seq3:62-1039(-)